MAQSAGSLYLYGKIDAHRLEGIGVPHISANGAPHSRPTPHPSITSKSIITANPRMIPMVAE